MTSGREDECVDVLVKECLGSSPELNWLMTHVLSVSSVYTHSSCVTSSYRSLQPATLLPKFLERVLQLPLRPDSSAFSSVGQSLEFLGHTHRAVVGESVVSVVGKVVRGEVGEGEKWSRQVELLLRLGPLCEGVLSLTSQDCLKLGLHYYFVSPSHSLLSVCSDGRQDESLGSGRKRQWRRASEESRQQ